MKTHLQLESWLRRNWAALRATVLEHDAVQGEAVMDSLRRYRRLAFFTVPMHAAVAWLFGGYARPSDSPDLVLWSRALTWVNLAASCGGLVAGLLAHWVLRYHQRASAVAMALLMLIGVSYLAFGAASSLIDLRAHVDAGLAIYMVTSVVVGVMMLIRPAISIPMYLLAYVLFAVALEGEVAHSPHRVALHIAALVAPALALAVSMATWWQYAQGVLLRRQLSTSNEILLVQQQDLAFMAGHDVLTGLYNRREFMRQAQLELDRSRRVPAETSVIMVDLDYFKKINDHYGHPGGDAVLQAVAVCLGQGLRSTDTLARLGGEEFIALLPHTALERAVQVAEKLSVSLRQLVVPFDGQRIMLTASLGVSSLVPGEAWRIEAVYAAADRALYTAKQQGRDRVESARPAASDPLTQGHVSRHDLA